MQLVTGEFMSAFDDIIGQTLNNGLYNVRRHIGDGNSARTYVVVDTFSNTKKVMKVVFSSNNKAFEQLEQIKRLNHPNLVVFFEEFKSHFSIYNLITEYSDNGSLKTVIDENQKNKQTISRIDMLDWSLAILEGLFYLNSKNIIHMNIKPENLLLDKTSSIKISDISLNKNEKRVLQMSKVVNYLSPELVREESYSENTDTWSFGCVVFELLHLKKAFDGNNQIEILNSILNTELVDFDALNLTETFDFILRHSLDRDKAARLTCTQMLKSLTGNGEIESINCRKLLNGHKWSVHAFAWGTRGELISSSWDETIKVWDIEKSECLKTITNEKQKDVYLSMLVDDKGRLITGSLNCVIDVWDLESGKSLKLLTGHTEKVNSLVISKQSRLISGSGDKSIRVWDIEAEVCTSVLNGHVGSVLALVVGKNEELISGSSDHMVKLWSLVKNECLKTLTGHTDYVRALVVNKDGFVISGSNDKTIKIWDLNADNEICVKTLIGHTSEVSALVLSKDDELISASSDITVKVWNLKGERRTRLLAGHDKSVFCLTISKLNELVTGSEDKTIRVWKY